MNGGELRSRSFVRSIAARPMNLNVYEKHDRVWKSVARRLVSEER